jgi:hypothetical protein
MSRSSPTVDRPTHRTRRSRSEDRQEPGVHPQADHRRGLVAVGEAWAVAVEEDYEWVAAATGENCCVPDRSIQARVEHPQPGRRPRLARPLRRLVRDAVEHRQPDTGLPREGAVARRPRELGRERYDLLQPPLEALEPSKNQDMLTTRDPECSGAQSRCRQIAKPAPAIQLGSSACISGRRGRVGLRSVDDRRRTDAGDHARSGAH